MVSNKALSHSQGELCNVLKNLKDQEYECSQGDDDDDCDVMEFKSRGSKQHGRRADQSSPTKQAIR